MRHVIRRLGIYLLAIWVALTLNFFLPRLAPGDPASALFFRLSQHGMIAAFLDSVKEHDVRREFCRTPPS